MDKNHPPLAFGVFNPVGHVLLAFRTATATQTMLPLLAQSGFDVAPTTYSPEEMIAQVDHALADASPLAIFGQELNLATAHREMAVLGCSFLVVPAPHLAQAQQVAALGRTCKALSAQYYGRFVIEELIRAPADMTAIDILAEHKL